MTVDLRNPIAARFRTARTASGATVGVYLSSSFADALRDGDALTGADVMPGNVSLLRQVRTRGTDGDRWVYGAHRTAAGWKAAMLNGDEAGRAQVESMRAAVAPALLAPLSVKRRTARGDQGDEFCIHAARGGNLSRAWTRRQRAVAKTPAPITVVVPMTSNGGSDADTFAWRAAVALALVGPLLRAGYRVELISADLTRNTFHGNSAPRFMVAAHRIAGNGTGLDVPRIMAALSSAHLRHATFNIMAGAPWQTNDGLGQAVDDSGVIAEALVAAGLIRPNTDVLTVPSDLRGETAARKWLAAVSKDYA
jgi:hypothetical protein